MSPLPTIGISTTVRAERHGSAHAGRASLRGMDPLPPPSLSPAGPYEGRISTLLAVYAELADELAGLPAASTQAGHLRHQLADLAGTIERLTRRSD